MSSGSSIKAASALGVPVYGHAWATPLDDVFLLGAIEAGFNGVTHLIGIAPAIQRPGASQVELEMDDAETWFAWLRGLWQTTDSALTDKVIDDMVKRGVWLEPTLLMDYYWPQDILPGRSLRWVGNPPPLRQLLQSGRDEAPERRPTYPATYAEQSRFIRRFVERGGLVIAGSDSRNPGVDFYEEMRLIAEATGSPMEGLLAATSHAAIALQRPDLGTIEPGKVADLVVHARNPLDALEEGMEVAQVIKAGVIHDGVALTAEFQAEYRERAWLHRTRPVLWLLGAAILGMLVLALRRRRGRH